MVARHMTMSHADVYKLAMQIIEAEARAERPHVIRSPEEARTFLPLKLSEGIAYAEEAAGPLEAVGLLYNRGPQNVSTRLLISAWMAISLAANRAWGPMELRRPGLDRLLLEGFAGAPIASFDGERIYGSESYVELVGEIAAKSRGIFVPGSVVCTMENSSTEDEEDGEAMFELTISAQGRTHAARLRATSDWTDLEGLAAAIDAVLKGGRSAHRAWWEGGGNECLLTFLTDAQGELLRARGWELRSVGKRRRTRRH